MRTVYASRVGGSLYLGKRGTNETVRVLFPLEEGMDEIAVLHKRVGDEHPYAVPVSITAGGVEWVIGLADTAVAGTGVAEVIYKKGGAVAKSVTYTTRCDESIDDGEIIVPTAAESWVQHVAELTASAQLAERGAEAAAEVAVDSKNDAQDAAQRAAEQAARAERAADQAEQARDSAVQAAGEALEKANAAQESAGEAALQMSYARGYAAEAKEAKEAADVHAQTAASYSGAAAERAENAQNSAENAQNSAENAQNSAESAQTSAQEAQTAAEQARVDVASETSARTIADAALKRSLDMLWKLNEGISYVFETDDAAAYSKAVLSGAVVGDVQSIGGKSVVFNQIFTDVNYIFDKSINIKNSTTYYGYSSFVCDHFVSGHVFYLSISCNSNDEDVVSARIAKVSSIFLQCEVGNAVSGVRLLTSENKDFRIFVFAKTAGKYTANCIVNVCDLTAMFGAGNEPTAEQFEAMFPADYYPYTPPTIISADVESVTVIGRNRFDKNAVTDNVWINSQGIVEPASSYCVSDYIPVDAGVSYLFGNRGTSRTMFYDASKRVINPGTWGTGGVSSRQTFVVPSGASYVRCAVTMVLRDAFFVIRQGTERDEYTPFEFESIPIPAAVRALPGYGWSGNTVDFAAKKYIQTVAAQSIGEDGRLAQELYPAPIETDISALLDDSFENIEVEPGGTIEFKQSGDFRLPVPNREEYIVSVADAGGGA